eukprot:scaffold237874_cov27-Tisochrysis_lutea.AAC.1
MMLLCAAPRHVLSFRPSVAPPAAAPPPVHSRALRTRCPPAAPHPSPLPLFVQFLLVIHSSTHTMIATNKTRIKGQKARMGREMGADS